MAECISQISAWLVFKPMTLEHESLVPYKLCYMLMLTVKTGSHTLAYDIVAQQSERIRSKT